MSNLLHQKIAQDLNIEQFKNEEEECYGNRLIYSAVAAWIRTALLGKSYSDISVDTAELSIDVMHLLTRIEPIAEALMSAILHADKWFGDVTEDSKGSVCVKRILDYMKDCDEIAVLSDRRRLTVVPQRVFHFGDCSVNRGGVHWQIENRSLQTIGLGRWGPKTQESAGALIEELRIPGFQVEQWIDELIKDAPWSSRKPVGDFMLFTPQTGAWHRNSWKSSNISEIMQGVYLIKNSIGAYSLLLKSGNLIKSVLFDGWYEREREICRIMYALNLRSGKPASFEVEIFDDYVITHIHSRLPRAEEKLLLLSSWPYRTIDDIYKKIIPNKLWPDIKHVLENLGVRWVVKSV